MIHLAETHDIEFDPKQVTVRTSGLPEHRVFYIAVHYAMPVNLLYIPTEGTSVTCEKSGKTPCRTTLRRFHKTVRRVRTGGRF